MTVASSMAELHVKLNRVEYAIVAAEAVHDGEECPEDEYCEMCRKRILAAVDRLSELPGWIKVMLWIFMPINTWRLRRETRWLREWLQEQQ